MKTEKRIAIYCRVSTEDQEREGTSLDTQRASCLQYCQEHNYQVLFQFIETASGLTLNRPELNDLRNLVRAERIDKIVIYCLDRFSRKPEHGVILTMELEKHNVSLEAVSEDIDNTEMGKLISYIRGFAANLEAEKIKERTTRGIRSRVFDKGLPVTFRAPYGYKWDTDNVRLIPDGNHQNIKLIFDMALAGKTYDAIISELKERGIVSPAGLTDWNKHTLSRLLHEPVYAGKYYAFKSEAVEPKKRNGTLYGKTSVSRIPEDKWHLIPGIEVIDPLLTEGQRAVLLDQLEKRKNLSKRNANNDYLLRGMIFCETHKGKKGNPRVYHGQPDTHGKSDVWRYKCPVGGCNTPHIDGEAIEHVIKQDIAWLFNWTPEEFYEKLTDINDNQKTKSRLEAEIKKLESERGKTIEKMAQLEDDRLSGSISNNDVYKKLRLKYDSRLIQVQDRQDSILEQLSQFDYHEQAFESWQDIRSRFLGRLDCKNDGLTKSEWRELLVALNYEVHVYPFETLHENEDSYGFIDITDVAFNLKIQKDPKLLTQSANKYNRGRHIILNVVLKRSLPIMPERVSDIVLPFPGNGSHNKTGYPLHYALVDFITINTDEPGIRSHRLPGSHQSTHDELQEKRHRHVE